MTKKYLLKIYTFTLLSKERANYYQKLARDEEWNSIESYIINGNFLDVGCGSGYSMQKAQKKLNCTVFGIDPDPYSHGVGRFGSNFLISVDNIKPGIAENIPYSDDFFDTVYSSHVLEHVGDIQKSLQEMKRVVKKDGVIIIGVPTSTMAWINWFSQLIFTTHIKLVSLLFSKIINTAKIHWWEIFVPVSHSIENKSLIYDLKNYDKRVWLNHISKELTVKGIIFPLLYPYPEYIQLFKAKKFPKLSSSVFFICTVK